MINFFKKNYFNASLVLAVLFLGLCSLHFFSARATWLDENMVLKSLVEFDFFRIFGVLKHEQAFPRVHLFLIKLISKPFEYHVYALRLISFISMLSAYFVWNKIYSCQFSGRVTTLFCLFAFCCSYRMVYYAAELKPYSMDVLSVGFFVLYILRQGKMNAQNLTKYDYIAALILPFLNVLGYASFFIFWMVCYNFVLLSFKDRKFLLITCLSCLAAGVSVVVLYYTDLQYVLHLSSLQKYWDSYFICYESAGCFFSTFGEGVKRLVTFWFGNSKGFVQAAVVFIPFAVFAIFKYGFISVWKNRGKLFTLDALGLALLAELFVFGVLHKYPFTGERVTLYLAPFMYYFIFRGLNAIKVKPLRFFMLTYYVLFCAVCFMNTLIVQIGLY